MVDLEKTITITRKDFIKASADASAFVAATIDKNDKDLAMAFVHFGAITTALALGQLFDGKMIEDMVKDDEEEGDARYSSIGQRPS